MKLSEIKSVLNKLDKIQFKLPSGELVPSHFHVTEIGKVTKHFIDCGGTLRMENRVNFQLWNANDYDHRLHPEKLVQIIELSEKLLGVQNEEIEVEYQHETIGKYGIEFDGTQFLLTNMQTDCLAKEQCGIPAEKQKVQLSELNVKQSCTPGGGCC